MKVLTKTDFHFDGQKGVYHGKVHDVYNISDDLIVMVATDRISAFDVVLPKEIPLKGQVLNRIVTKSLDSTKDICSNWKIATSDLTVTVGIKCEGFRAEMIIRSILTGNAWCKYSVGARELRGVKLPDGTKENEHLLEPIVTPAARADEGHNLNISKKGIISQGIVPAGDYTITKDYTRRLFVRGQEVTVKQGLILMGTKYESSREDGRIYLINETHALDSSRYLHTDDYEERLAEGESQKQLSEEFTRQWLIGHNFMSEPGQTIPKITDECAESISERYIELCEHITGEKFRKATDHDDLAVRIERSISDCPAPLR